MECLEDNQGDITQQHEQCADYCSHTGCEWTWDYSCPWATNYAGQPLGLHGTATNDGSTGYQCCCEINTNLNGCGISDDFTLPGNTDPNTATAERFQCPVASVGPNFFNDVTIRQFTVETVNMHPQIRVLQGGTIMSGPCMLEGYYTLATECLLTGGANTPYQGHFSSPPSPPPPPGGILSLQTALQGTAYQIWLKPLSQPVPGAPAVGGGRRLLQAFQQLPNMLRRAEKAGHGAGPVDEQNQVPNKGQTVEATGQSAEAAGRKLLGGLLGNHQPNQVAASPFSCLCA